jgi:hypothetical protein
MAGRPSRGSRRRVLFACPNTLDRRLACCLVGGAIFGNQFQSRSFVGTSSNASPLMRQDLKLADNQTVGERTQVRVAESVLAYRQGGGRSRANVK